MMAMVGLIMVMMAIAQLSVHYQYKRQCRVVPIYPLAE